MRKGNDMAAVGQAEEEESKMAHGNAGCVLSAILLPFDYKDPVGASTEPANSSVNG